MRIQKEFHRSNPLAQLGLDVLRTRSSMKWQTHPEDVLPLWVAEMDVLLAEPVATAVHGAVSRGDTGYPAGTAYIEAFAEFAQERWGWGDVHPDRSAVVPDVMMGIVEVLRLISEPGDSVILTSPVYAPFYSFVEHADRRVVTASLSVDGRVDLESLEDAFVRARAMSPRTVLLISNPHNPTGAVHTHRELCQIATLSRLYGIRVISDEIHSPLVLAGASFTPYLSVPGSEDAFAVTSASKAFNLAGLKAALVLAGSEAQADLARMPEEVGHGPSHVGVIAHTAAFQSGGRWLDDLLLGLDANRTLLGALLAEHLPEIQYRAPEGTYLAWLDCRKLGLEDHDLMAERGVVSDLSGPAKHFLDHARVALSSGHVFGPGGAGHVRLNFATHPDILTEAISRISRSLSSRPVANFA